MYAVRTVYYDIAATPLLYCCTGTGIENQPLSIGRHLKILHRYGIECITIGIVDDGSPNNPSGSDKYTDSLQFRALIPYNNGWSEALSRVIFIVPGCYY
jgi:hypothetical protein